MRRRKNDIDPGLLAAVFLIGGPIYLLMTSPLIFWLLFVPIVVVLITAFIGWLKK